ncbi:MAG: small multi-drug export protein [Defluviitaleaceae bacterium]|nr:small multi-drug export protein [Defluviitaleaceae bacterium]MCL2837316.1 small multi-drug export protein [Defluviitaleaceae bacterium]
MTQVIIEFFSRFTIAPEVIIFIISIMPVTELRGGLIAASLMNVPVVKAFIICYVANILPVPFILLFIKYIFKFLKRFEAFEAFIIRMEEKAMKKSGSIRQKQYVGLLLFSIVPIPGMGAWMGSLIVSLLGMDRRKSFAVIAFGVLICGFIMIILAYLIPGFIGFKDLTAAFFP